MENPERQNRTQLYPLCNKPTGAKFGRVPCQLPEGHSRDRRHSITIATEYREPHEYIGAKSPPDIQNHTPCEGCGCLSTHPIHFNPSEIEAKQMRERAKKADQVGTRKVEDATHYLKLLGMEFFASECRYCGAGPHERPHAQYCPVITAMHALVKLDRWETVKLNALKTSALLRVPEGIFKA